PKKFHYTLSVPMSQTSNTSSLLSYFNAYNHDQIDSSLPSHFNIYEQDITPDFSPPCFNTYELALPYYSYKHNIANISSFYPNAYEYYDNVNTSSSDSLTESDIEAQPEGADNGIYDKRENNEYEDSENEEERKNNLLVLRKGMKFSTWELAESYLTDYAKQEGFSFQKKRQVVNSDDYTITRR
ncbi:24903_t:CDS:2, partial [Racocetra persica]